VERLDRVVRLTSPAGGGWGDGVVWSHLDERNADEEIAAAIRYFGGLGRTFEWKHHGYDRPPDLPRRLLAAGFRPEPRETLVAGEVDEVLARCGNATAPTGVTLRRLRDDPQGRRADWDAIAALHSEVFEKEAGALVLQVAAAHAAAPDSMSVYLAESDDGRVVCAARMELAAGTDFASLWGGGTLPDFRGRGIYRALVALRAAEARDRGFRYLQVDASDDSRPILERLGLQVLTTTTPYVWSPA
jgi:ribosomal protein S18 acetylase RimI-like enzyme